MGVVYSGSRLDLHGYNYSDWGSDKHTRWSTLGYTVKAGGPVSWILKLKPIVIVASIEAKCVALFFLIIQDLVWIRMLLRDIGCLWVYGSASLLYADIGLALNI